MGTESENVVCVEREQLARVKIAAQRAMLRSWFASLDADAQAGRLCVSRWTRSRRVRRGRKVSCG